MFNDRVQSEVSEQERSRATSEVSEKTGTGRVVVEIKQQPRRGRGTHSAAPRSERDRGADPGEQKDAEAPTTGAPVSE
jgi:hypothetical protein